MRKWILPALMGLGFLLGLGITLYPAVSNYLLEKNQSTAMQGYIEEQEKVPDEVSERLKQEAREYNEKLREGTVVLTDPFDPEALKYITDEYEEMLNPDGDGLMGYLEIPSIKVYLPVYHGTSDGVLQAGVGHLGNTSLPVGGENTHAVLSGHTGLPNARLLTDLDKLQEHDQFYLHVLDEVLAYVRQILSAEVLDKELGEIHLLGLDSAGLRYESHHIKEIYGIPHPMPEYRMGRICIGLNELRTFVRETELAAARAFQSGDTCTRPDIVEAMNRLSSVIYILFCRQLTGRWPGQQEPSEMKDLPGFLVEASGRHVHLTQQAIDVLFGENLHEKSPLSQPGQYASEERVRLVTAKGEIDNVVVLGPPRGAVQVEMSLTDARILGITIPVNLSGDLKGAADVILVGPKGIYNAVGSVIASKAHIHMTPEDARLYGVEDGDSVAVRLETERPVTIDDVIIRVSEKFSLAMHMDYDEANACSYKKGDMGYIIKKN